MLCKKSRDKAAYLVSTLGAPEDLGNLTKSLFKRRIRILKEKLIKLLQRMHLLEIIGCEHSLKLPDLLLVELIMTYLILLGKINGVSTLEDKPSVVILGVKDVHRRRADEGRNEDVLGIAVNLLGSADLLNPSLAHNHDLGRHCHSLCLVVSYVDGGSADLLVNSYDLRTHLHSELCIKVGKRLIHQEELGISYDRTAESNTLHLTARKLLGSSVKIRTEVKNLSRLKDSGSDLLIAHLNVMILNLAVLYKAVFTIDFVSLGRKLCLFLLDLCLSGILNIRKA